MSNPRFVTIFVTIWVSEWSDYHKECQENKGILKDVPAYKAGASPFGHVGGKQGRKDLNPVREFWRLAALPGARP